MLGEKFLQNEEMLEFKELCVACHTFYLQSASV